MKTLVIGASENTDRYSNIAIRMLTEIKRPTIGIGRKRGRVIQTDIHKGLPELENIHTVTLYISAKYQEEYEKYILEDIKPKRIIFNPGTENTVFYKKAQSHGIEAVEACTLVMIRTGQY